MRKDLKRIFERAKESWDDFLFRQHDQAAKEALEEIVIRQEKKESEAEGRGNTGEGETKIFLDESDL